MAETRPPPSWHSTLHRELHAKYEKAADCLSKDGTRYWRSMTSRPSTGNTCGRPIPLKHLRYRAPSHDPIEGCLSTGRRSRWSQAA